MRAVRQRVADAEPADNQDVVRRGVTTHHPMVVGEHIPDQGHVTTRVLWLVCHPPVRRTPGHGAPIDAGPSAPRTLPARDRSQAAARHEALARPVIAPSAPQESGPARLRFLSRPHQEPASSRLHPSGDATTILTQGGVPHQTSAPGATRTPGQQFRKLLLYPPELRGPSCKLTPTGPAVSGGAASSHARSHPRRRARTRSRSRGCHRTAPDTAAPRSRCRCPDRGARTP
jgi:hypothetical protein